MIVTAIEVNMTMIIRVKYIVKTVSYFITIQLRQ